MWVSDGVIGTGHTAYVACIKLLCDCETLDVLDSVARLGQAEATDAWG